MTKPFQIFQEKSVGYDEEGRHSFSSTYYIKLDESAEVMLGKLKGARLSFFTCISLHEIAVLQRDEPPYSIDDISRVTRYSVRALKYAAPWLLEKGFAVVCGTTLRGEKMYRPTDTYAWFGERYAHLPRGVSEDRNRDPGNHYAKIAYPPRGGAEGKIAHQAADDPHAKNDRRYAKSSTPPGKKQQNGVQKTDTVVRNRLRSDSSEEQLSSSPESAFRILIGAGLVTADRDFAQDGITEEHARAIADWIAHPTAQNKYIENRASYARRCLLVNPGWQRPRKSREESDYVGGESLRRTDFSDELWHRVNPMNRRQIISKEKGTDWEETTDDPHYRCEHTAANRHKRG